MLDRSLIDRHLAAQPYGLLFVTVSGAHLYGFESADSDYDLRGCHVLPAREVFGLKPLRETVEVMDKSGAVEVDLVTHDVKKFVTLLMKNNGYVLEQVFSPLVVRASADFEELRALAAGCVTKNHRHHFRRFADNQWDLVIKKPTAKGLLYTYRVLLAGIHLMRAGRVESNLRVLNQEFRLPYVDDLIAVKVGGAEKGALAAGAVERHEREFARLCAVLDEAREKSSLRDEVGVETRRGLEELLVRVRMGTVSTPPGVANEPGSDQNG
jgi:uncharacterized protein